MILLSVSTSSSAAEQDHLHLSFMLERSDHSALVSEEEISHLIYDAMKDQPYISVLKISEFESGPRVVKMVLNTQCYQYQWLTM